MEWISNNWFFLLFAAIFIGMHVLGYGCGGHGKHGKNDSTGKDAGHAHSVTLESKTAGKKGGSCH